MWGRRGRSHHGRHDFHIVYDLEHVDHYDDHGSYDYNNNRPCEHSPSGVRTAVR